MRLLPPALLQGVHVSQCCADSSLDLLQLRQLDTLLLLDPGSADHSRQTSAAYHHPVLPMIFHHGL
ncbi:hypothetical protein ACG33_05560 [Steroidobacter denitrificans]|uniref:Uncharacterized protein n=1 Tax=Steroidobacter denitrificans TaxID=465721 RepID=A0A127FAB2_STEDE|nr:hypothetical protein ACG33_05560 [Steroidobacter denitrificans]